MQILTYQGIKITPKKQEVINDTLVIEAPLQININNEPYTVVMRTPDDDIELIRGLLFSEDIYKEANSFFFEIIEKEKKISTIVNITISKGFLGKGYLNKRTLLSVSSCGVCGKQELKDLKVGGEKLLCKGVFSSDILYQMFAKMNIFQETFAS